MLRFAVPVVLVVLVGCSSGGPTAPSLVKVSGTVSLDGKPMPAGEVRFGVMGYPPKVIEIKGGAFAGEAYVGKNQIDVVWEKDGPPNPTDPTSRIKVNTVADRFSGPKSVLNAEITEAKEFKFAVTSRK